MVLTNHTPADDNNPFKNVTKKILVIPIEPIGVKWIYPNIVIIKLIAKPIHVPKHIKQVNSLYKL